MNRLAAQLIAVLLTGLFSRPVGADMLLGAGSTPTAISASAAAAASVTPDQISGLRLWLKGGAGLTTTSNVAAQFTSANSEYLSAADNALFPFSGDWTFAVWVKADSFTATTGNFIAGQWDAGANQISWALLYNDFTFNANPKRFSFWTSVDGTNGSVYNAPSPGQPATGTWYFIVIKHVAASRTKKIKVNDGTEDSTTYASGTIWDSTARFCLGSQLNNNAPGQPWNGQIRLAGWWSRVTTSSEDTWLYNSGAGRAYSELGSAGNGSNLLTNLVAYWNLGEKSGTRSDSGPNSLTLTDNNTVTMSTGPVGGVNNTSNQYVSAWADQSGNGNNLTAASGEKYGIYVASARNSLPGVQFDGAGSSLRISSMIGLTPGQARTIAVVYQSPSSSAQAITFVQGQAGSTTPTYAIESNAVASAGTKFCLVVTGATFDSTAACDTSYHQHYVAFSTMSVGGTISTNTTWRIDQSSQTLTLKGGSDAFASMSAANFTGLGFFPGSPDSTYASTIAEVIVYDHALSTTDRDSLEAYLKSRYAL